MFVIKVFSIAVAAILIYVYRAWMWKQIKLGACKLWGLVFKKKAE